MTNPSSINSDLPLSTHLLVIRGFIERERRMRDFYRKDGKRIEGIAEADGALESLQEIEKRMEGLDA